MVKAILGMKRAMERTAIYKKEFRDMAHLQNYIRFMERKGVKCISMVIVDPLGETKG
jgi:hypothetical protein